MLTVEIVEDDLYMRTLLSEWLSNEGYRVHSQSRLGDTPRAGVDAVVLGLRNAPEQIAQAVARAKALYPGAPLVGLSTQLSRTPRGESRRAGELGVRRLVAKPCSRAEFLEAVTQAIAGAA